MLTLIRETAKDVLQHAVFPGRFVWRLPRASGAIALTFDDGPHPVHTPAVLDMLARAGVPATFFMVGRDVERHPDIVRRMVAEGHAVGGHSYDHTVITSLTPEALRDDLWHCRKVITTAGGRDSPLFRPPKGEVSLASIRTVCRAGFKLVHWTKTYSDYRQDGTAALAARIASLPPRGGDVLLFHDHNSYTVEALAALIPRWRAEGMIFKAL